MNKFLSGVLFAMVAAVTSMATGCGYSIVDPGNRGVVVDWGNVKEPALSEGFHFYCVFPGCHMTEVSVRQQRQEIEAACSTSDMQEVILKVAILYRIPESSVTKVFRDYHGEPFESLILSQAQESIKDATTTRSAELVVKQRLAVKTEALASLRKNVGDIIIIEDLIVTDVVLSKMLTASIESKMVQEQEAEKAKFTKQKAEIDTEMAVAVAQGEATATLARAGAEAESIRIRGKALSENPSVIQLQLVERWNGVSPQVVTGGGGLNIVLPALKQ